MSNDKLIECWICGKEQDSGMVRNIGLRPHCHSCRYWFNELSTQGKFEYLTFDYPMLRPYNLQDFFFGYIDSLINEDFDRYEIVDALSDSLFTNFSRMSDGNEPRDSEFALYGIDLRFAEFKDIACDSRAIANGMLIRYERERNFFYLR